MHQEKEVKPQVPPQQSSATKNGSRVAQERRTTQSLYLLLIDTDYKKGQCAWLVLIPTI